MSALLKCAGKDSRATKGAQYTDSRGAGKACYARDMTTLALFPTLIYTARLPSKGLRKFNSQLLRECWQLQADDTAGQRWSKKNYPGGFTSYNSACRMHTLSPTFALLERKLNGHVKRFVDSLQLDLTNREMAMTDCWVNIMPPGVVHTLHLHPLSTISGTYYVQTPKGSSALKFEDPRLDRFMAAPPRRHDCDEEMKPWFHLPAEAGKLVLFESWLRHEVSPNQANTDRVSISFNYNWF
jgi:uncharacterized protein (TIGR02466 family)